MNAKLLTFAVSAVALLALFILGVRSPWAWPAVGIAFGAGLGARRGAR